MLKGESILCFAPEPWDSMWRSRQQIMARLARCNKVLFVEPRIYLRPLISALARGRLGEGGVKGNGLRKVAENLFVFRPPAYAPISGRRSIETITGFLRVAALRRAMRSLEMSRPVLWLERPDMWNEVGRYGEKLLVYRVVDEYTAYDGMREDERLLARRREEYLLGRADLVLVTSETLHRSKSPFNRHTHLLPHGVDCSAFSTAAGGSPAPVEIHGLPRPIVGYSGLIGARLDLDLLADMAVNHPSWSLVLVGQVNPVACEEGLAKMRQLDNVHFLGPVDARLVPGYIKAFDVGLIPYHIDDQSYNANPLKLLEYLACGKPVVSVDIPSVRPFASVAKVAQARDQFAARVEEALADTDREAIKRRTEIAAQNTWDSRVELFSELVEAALREKSSGGGEEIPR